MSGDGQGPATQRDRFLPRHMAFQGAEARLRFQALALAGESAHGKEDDAGASVLPVSSASAFPLCARAHVKCQVELVQEKAGPCGMASALKRG